MDTTTAFIAPAAGRLRRLHSAEFKAKVVDVWGQRGVSIAFIALANGINANLARRWVKASSTPRATGQTGALTSFVPVRFEPEPVSPSACDVCIEVRRSAGTVTVSWPTSVHWLRDTHASHAAERRVQRTSFKKIWCRTIREPFPLPGLA